MIQSVWYESGRVRGLTDREGGRKASPIAARRETYVRIAGLWAAFLFASAILFSGCARREKGTDPAAAIREGWDFYRLGEFNSAILSFEKAVQAAPETDPLHATALYGLATTWSLRQPQPDQNKPLAARDFEKVIALAPKSDLAAWSLLALARMKHLVPVGEDPDYEQVRAAYQAVMDRFPDHLASHEAFIFLQSTYVASMTPANLRLSETNLLSFIEQHPSSGFLNEAYALLCVCYENLGLPEKWLWAEVRAFETAEIDPSNPQQENSWSYWRIASVAEFEAGDFDTAREFYGRLIKEYPEDIRVYAAKQALKRMDGVESRMRSEMAAGKNSKSEI
jgi:tetratricopeptide (TPR) repeat protein